MPYPLPFVLAAALLVLPLAGCDTSSNEPPAVRSVALRLPPEPPLPDPASVEADSAAALLRRVPPALAAEALRRLEQRPYTVEVRLAELDEAGGVRRRSRRVLHREPGSERAGGETLLGEALAGQGGGPLGLLRHVDPVALLLPEDPQHLNPRTSGGYAVRLIPDTTLGGRRLRGAEAALREGAGEPLRRVRSWVDAVTGEPIAVEVERASSSVLLSEAGHAFVWLARDADGALVPSRVHVDARVDIPMERPYHFVLDLLVR
jgi:hypothetical protein